MQIRNVLPIAACWCLLAGRVAAEEPKCPKGLQPFANRCISQYMADYVSCVEASGGNHEEISLEISNAKAERTSAGAGGSGSGIVLKGSGSLALDLATEHALEKKFREKWENDGMEKCLKALGAGKPARDKAPAKSKPIPQTKEPSSKLNFGPITQGPGSALSIGQQGGITANNVIVGGQVPPPHVTWTQEPLAPGSRKYEPRTSFGMPTEEQSKDIARREEYVANPGVFVSASVDAPWGSAFAAFCDRPCETTDATIKSGLYQQGYLRSTEQIVAIVFLTPNPVPPGISFGWEIHSLDKGPVRIEDVRAVTYSSTSESSAARAK